MDIGKNILREKVDKDLAIPLSIGDLVIQFQNRNLLHRIFSIYGFDPELIKLNK